MKGSLLAAVGLWKIDRNGMMCVLQCASGFFKNGFRRRKRRDVWVGLWQRLGVYLLLEKKGFLLEWKWKVDWKAGENIRLQGKCCCRLQMNGLMITRRWEELLKGETGTVELMWKIGRWNEDICLCFREKPSETSR